MAAFSRPKPANWALLALSLKLRMVQAISIADLNVLGSVPLLTPAVCISAINMDLPGCTQQDFDNGCSSTCAASVEDVRTTINDRCGSGTGLLGALGGLISTVNTSPLQSLCQVVVTPSSAAPSKATATIGSTIQTSTRPRPTTPIAPPTSASVQQQAQQQTQSASIATSQLRKEPDAQSPATQSAASLTTSSSTPNQSVSETATRQLPPATTSLLSKPAESLLTQSSTTLEASATITSATSIPNVLPAAQTATIASSPLSSAISTTSLASISQEASSLLSSLSSSMVTLVSIATPISTTPAAPPLSVSSLQAATSDSSQLHFSVPSSIVPGIAIATNAANQTASSTPNGANIAVVSASSSTPTSTLVSGSAGSDGSSVTATATKSGSDTERTPTIATPSAIATPEVAEAPAAISSTTSDFVDTTHTIYQGFAEVTGTLSAETFSPAAMKRNQGIAGAVIGTFLAVAAIIAALVYFFLYKPRHQRRSREENYVVYQQPDRPAPNAYEKGFCAYPPRPMRTMSPTGDMVTPPRFPPAAGSHYSLVSRLEDGTYLRSESATSHYEVSPITPQRASTATDYSVWYAMNGFDMYLPRRPAEEQLVSDDEDDDEEGIPYITPLQPVLRRSMSTIPETQELDGEETCIYELPGTQAWPTAGDMSMKKAWT